MESNAKKGTICCVLSALVFGLTPVLASMSFEMGSNPMTLTFYRNAMAVPILLAALLIRKVDFRITKKEFLWLCITGIFFSATTTFFLYFAYDYIGVGLATTLHFLYPVFTVLFVRILFKDKLDKAKIAALVLATIGVAVATGEGGTFAIVGICTAVLSAITYASYMTAIEKTPIGNIDSMKSMFYMCLIITVFMAFVDIPMGNIVYNLPPMAMLCTFGIAIANSVFAYVLLIMGIKALGAGNAAIYSMLEPVFGVIGGVMFLGETLPVLKLISCILILTAVFIPIMKDRQAALKGK